jgi:uncharacterized membrane protein
MALRGRSRRGAPVEDGQQGEDRQGEGRHQGDPPAEEPRAGAPVAARRRPRGQRLLGLIFIGAGFNHFVIPRHYRRIVPPSVDEWMGADTAVAVSGVAELAGGLAVLVPRTRRLAGLWLIALLAAVFPANLHMARNPHLFQRIPRWALYARLPLQPLMMWWAWRATRVGRP